MVAESNDSIEILHKFNRAVFSRRLDEFNKLLEEYSDFLVKDESWILRYCLLVSPNNAFFNKAFQACIKNDATMYSWMLEGPKN